MTGMRQATGLEVTLDKSPSSRAALALPAIFQLDRNSTAKEMAPHGGAMIIKLTEVQFEWVGDGSEPVERSISIMSDKLKTWAEKKIEDQEMFVTEVTFTDQDTIFVKETPAQIDALVILLDERNEDAT